MSFSIPKFVDLPPVEGGNERSAWGVFGKDDQLGTLNHQTPETVKAASQTCIQTGEVFPLNWKIEEPSHPLFGRSHGEHKIVELGQKFLNDDIYVNLNSQISTQWDGNPRAGGYYNGVQYEEVNGPKDEGKLGMQNFAQKGIVGRGVLVDYRDYAERHGIEYCPGETHPIKLEHVKAILKEYNVTLQPGDVFLLRTGWIEWYEKLSDEERKKYAEPPAPSQAGLERTTEMLEWVWDNGISAMAADNVSLEWTPIPEGVHELHHSLLALFGCPIGELFDVQRLAKRLKQLDRVTFFFASAPLNVTGGVGSPANAIAII